ncbi:MAG: PQQ-like beta-propeller repeat protein [Gemmataceae bacterium]|nr:PQQ-like beta-propeller repeat protein [Gemmataceae bacterium]
MYRLAIALVFVSASLTYAEDWPSWRGPRLDGASAETDVPLEWSANKNIAWKTPIPGVGHSSPIVHGDRVFLTTCLPKDEKRVLLCLDRKTGTILWDREVVKSVLEPKHGLNSYASATPATDGKHVWVSFVAYRPRNEGDDQPRKPRDAGYVPKQLKESVSEMVVACCTVNGDLVWKKTPGQFYSRHGFCTCPIPYKDTIILNGDQDAEAYIVALNKADGKEKWRIERNERYRSYCAPLIVEAAGKTQMVLSGANYVDSYNPDTGEPIWKVKGPTEQFVASPVFGDGLFFLTAGFPTYHNLAIRPDGTGDVTKTHVAWHESKTAARKAAYVPSPIAHDKWFYVISDLGFLNCFEAKTGNRLWIEQLGMHHSASPISAGGRLYAISDEGDTYVLKAGATFEVLAKNSLGENCYSSPAISQGQLFLRTAGKTGSHLWCVGAAK